MAKVPTTLTTPKRTILVAEVEIIGAKVPSHVQVLFSIPGRESTLQYGWKLVNGMVDADQATDLSAVVSKHILDSLTLMCGVQAVIPLST